MSKLKVGDIVVLNSGGPLMTVIKSTKDKVKVVWFSELLEKFDEEFPLKALEKFEDDDDFSYLDAIEEIVTEGINPEVEQKS